MNRTAAQKQLKGIMSWRKHEPVKSYPETSSPQNGMSIDIGESRYELDTNMKRGGFHFVGVQSGN